MPAGSNMESMYLMDSRNSRGSKDGLQAVQKSNIGREEDTHLTPFGRQSARDLTACRLIILTWKINGKVSKVVDVYVRKKCIHFHTREKCIISIDGHFLAIVAKLVVDQLSGKSLMTYLQKGQKLKINYRECMFFKVSALEKMYTFLK